MATPVDTSNTQDFLPKSTAARRNKKRKTRPAFDIGAPKEAAQASFLKAPEDTFTPPGSSYFKFSAADILKEAYDFSQYRVNSTGVDEVSKLESLQRHGVKDEDYKELLQAEIQRLADTVSSEDPLIFDSEGLLDQTDKPSYEALSAVATWAKWSCSTVRLEDTASIIEHHPFPKVFHSCFPLLKIRYNEVHQLCADKVVKGRLPQPQDRHRKLYFKLVDYASGILARILVRVTKSHGLNLTVLALLAKLVVRVKFTMKDLEKNGAKALACADEAITAYREAETETQVISFLQDGAEGKGVEEVRVRMLDGDPSADLAALGWQIHREVIGLLFSAAIMSTCTSNYRGQDSEKFHHHAVVYETGSDGSLVLVTESSNNAVYTSSRKGDLNVCAVGLSLAKQNIEKLFLDKKTNQAIEPRRPDTSDVDECIISLKWDDKEPRHKISKNLKHWRTTKIDSVVSVLLPLSFVSSVTASLIDDLMATVTTYSIRTEPVQKLENKSFQARISVQSSVDKASQQRFETQDATTLSLSECGIIGSLKAGACIGPRGAGTLRDSGAVDGGSVQPGSHLAPAILNQNGQDDHRMREWVFSATSVTVKCRRFVIGTLLVCSILIIGALIMPFFVQNRIPGVDPFQITLFIWLVVGVILVAAKGRYVREWPWHDFVHGRVVCHSVVDLADVTGVDTQAIILKLLSDEHSTTLVTTGPYNGMFSRCAEANAAGFSINSPVHLTTMLASGFILLKVLSMEGEHLISLDARKKAVADYAHGSTGRVTYLSCMEIPSSTNAEKRGGEVLYLKQHSIEWNKLAGLYFVDAVFG
ncbi:hypothetical protein EJ04DRAFT_554380 [Polyplosphaeria fusca]|uniref:Uncharacterized protein n=1 Tax=Polyplosphaeria fusca TaxID=682080 RepID=A0A9P4UZ07_9PLEO|nr:hypothetical protein EJ04DRAFT_554380 [Polyplosphaeria fusca]